MSATSRVQRTYTLKITGFLPPALKELVPPELQLFAQRSVAKTINRQLWNYGYQLAGLGYEMCEVLAQPIVMTTPATPDNPSAFKYTALRQFFHSSANFSNNAYALVRQAGASYTELQRYWNEVGNLLQQSDMVPAAESFLLSGFSQRYLLMRLKWANWAWARQFIRALRNRLDGTLPSPLQRQPIPQAMADTARLLQCEVHLLPPGLTTENVAQVLRVAVKYSLVPCLGLSTPLPAGLFPVEVAALAEQLRCHLVQQYPTVLATVIHTTPLHRFVTRVTPEDIRGALTTIGDRVTTTLAQLQAQDRISPALLTFSRKIQVLQETPAVIELLAQISWLPQARLLKRVTQAVSILTRRKRLGGVVAALVAHLVVTKTLSSTPSISTPTEQMNPLVPIPVLTLPFHSTRYRPHPVAFPLLENKYTFHYASCEDLTSTLRHYAADIEVTSTAPLTAENRYQLLYRAVDAAHNPVFERGLTRYRSYLLDELPWTVSGSCVSASATALQQQPVFSQYLTTAPQCLLEVPPYLQRKIITGAAIEQLMLVPTTSPTGIPTGRITLTGTIAQLYRRTHVNPYLPIPTPADLPIFPRPPASAANLVQLLPLITPGIVSTTLNLSQRLAFEELVTASCLGLDLNRLNSDWALTLEGWCHGLPYRINPDYQTALNRQFRSWAAHLTVLEHEIACLQRCLTRTRHAGKIRSPAKQAHYHRQVKDLRCLHRKCHNIKHAAYWYAAEIIYAVITYTRPQYFFYEALEDLSLRGKRGSFAKLLTWMLTRVDSLMTLVASWCAASGYTTQFHAVNPRQTSTIHSGCGGRLHRGPGHWDLAECDRCHAWVPCHENAAFNVILHGLRQCSQEILTSLV